MAQALILIPYEQKPIKAIEGLLTSLNSEYPLLLGMKIITKLIQSL